MVIRRWMKGVLTRPTESGRIRLAIGETEGIRLQGRGSRDSRVTQIVRAGTESICGNPKSVVCCLTGGWIEGARRPAPGGGNGER
jgi:hypothetical protein